MAHIHMNHLNKLASQNLVDGSLLSSLGRIQSMK